MALRQIVSCLAVVAFLAGCTMPSDQTTTSPTTGAPAAEKPIDASTYTIAVDWTNPTMGPGTEFKFTEHIDGKVSTQSSHVGAHFGPNHVEAGMASATTYTTKCVHAAGNHTLPGGYEVTCTAPATPGTYYLRGHAQETRGTVVTNWWSDEVTFTVS